ncbi:MAG TPA: hypothetical protein VF676_05675 [Flavobacterium sp.]|jgi:hypothetical protein
MTFKNICPKPQQALPLLLVTLFVMLQTALFAQQNLENLPVTASGETVYVHANATTFVPGETLLYKLYCLRPASFLPSRISKIAYVELVSADQKKMVTQKLFLENGSGQGDIFIPASIPTGVYKLIGYTTWTTNRSVDKCYQMDIFIVNPFETNAAYLSSSQSAQTSVQQQGNVVSRTGATKLAIEKRVYSTRERVSLTPTIPDGNYSVSVRKIEALPTVSPLSATDFTGRQNESTSIIIDPAHIVELRGELFSGTITSKSGAAVSGKAVAVSAPGKSFGLQIGNTDASGRFYVTLDKFYPVSELHFQVLGDQRNDYTLTVDQHSVQLPLRFESAFKLDPNIRNSIIERSTASQIENAYSSRKTDSLTQHAQKPFFEPLAKDYVLSDYTRFPTFKETIVEVLSEMYYTNDNGKYELHLRDYSTQVKRAEPVLVLVDGLLIQDVNELFDYPMASVYKISILPGGYYYGSSIFSGVINIETIGGDYVSKTKGDFYVTANLLRPVAKKIYYMQDHSDAGSKRIPDYRVQLFWEPNYNGASAMSFYTSDVKGMFEVVIEGFSSEGKPVTVSDLIEVK